MRPSVLKESIGNLFSMDRPAESIPVIFSRRTKMPFPNDGCDLCGECSKACGAKAITVTEQWEIDLGRCLFCGRCAGSCPKKALELVDAPDYVLERKDLIFRSGESTIRTPGTIDEKKRKAIGRSVNIREVDTGSCNGCEVEINSLSNQFYDFNRFGIKIVASPRHADVLLVTGPLTENMYEAFLKVIAATPDPKAIIAAGSCAISGGVFSEGEVKKGIVGTADVDIYIPGCPPPPDAILRALLQAFGLTGQQ
ncbi:MAG: 4Fe-4S binding protein [Candidatus Methanoplasma sp.]|jgi:Ni,Fe-hydrogenase III small subunit/ferredoxin|nr:4Fe-4S binding protein [Candidatus Methanoplasma sp.]